MKTFIPILGKICLPFIFLFWNTLVYGQEVEVIGQLKISNGSQGEGKVLTSDTTGLATWKEPGGIPYPTLSIHDISKNSATLQRFARPNSAVHLLFWEEKL